MGEYDFLKCLNRHSLLNGHACSVNHFAARIAQHVNAQYLPLRVEKHFAESGRSFIFCHKTTGISHRKFGNTVFDIFILGLLFGQTDRSNLRISVNDTGNGVITHFVFQSGEVIDHHLAFATGCVGQH